MKAVVVNGIALPLVFRTFRFETSRYAFSVRPIISFSNSNRAQPGQNVAANSHVNHRMTSALTQYQVLNIATVY